MNHFTLCNMWGKWL